MVDYPKQGEIWWASFCEGWERPSIVVSRNELNLGRLVLVVPCTSSRVKERIIYPNHVLIPAGTGDLSKDTIAQTHLIQPIEVNQRPPASWGYEDGPWKRPEPPLLVAADF